jgi:site-specific recombinase XerD
MIKENEEEIRSRILTDMVDKLNPEETDELSKILDTVLYEYNIERKSTELAITDESNDILIKNFLGTKLLEGCSKKTVEHYRGTITRMVSIINKPIKDITTNDIRYHLVSWQINRQVSNTTLNNMRKVYSSFFKWLKTEQYIQENPMERIKPFKTEKVEVHPFTGKELELLFDNCQTVRDRALLEFLYSTGVRVSECADMNIDDIDFIRSTAIVRHGKGNKERKVYISDRCMYWLEKYLNDRKINDVALWTGRKGRLTKAGIEAVVRRVGDRANVHAHPHKFRHTLATDLIRRNAPLPVVQKILGHEDLSTTMIYVEVDDGEIKNTHKKLVT